MHTPGWHILSAVLLLAPAAAAHAHWRIEPLTTPAGGESYAVGVNNQGQVVGKARHESGNFRATLWEPTAETTREARDLGVLPGGGYSAAHRINNLGQVAGLSHTAGGDDHAAFWDEAGAITDVGTLGGPRSFAQDLNDHGVVVGSSDTERGSHAFTWTRAGGFVDYGNPNPQDRLMNAGFNGVNNAGLLVGTSFRLLEPFRAVMARQDDDTLVDLGPPGRSLSMANAVNDAGVIVGYSSRDGGAAQAAVFHGPDDFTQFGTLGLDESWAEDVNNAGDIVGTAFDGRRFRPFVYREGAMSDLTALLPADSGWDELLSASGVNDAGVIVGTGRYRGVVTGYVMTAVPEPGAAVLIVAGVLSLCRLYGSRLVRALLESRTGPVLRGSGGSNGLPTGARRRTRLARGE